MNKTTLLLALTIFSLAGCGSLESANSSSSLSPRLGSEKQNIALSDTQFYSKNNEVTWHQLQHTPLPTLQEAQATSQDPTAKGWLNLATISKKYSTNPAQLIKELQTWRSSNPSHPGNNLFPDDNTLSSIAATPPPKHIAILLPLHGSMAASGQIIRSGFLSAYYENMGQSTTQIKGQTVSFYDTNENPDLGALYQKVQAEGADLIVGPLTKTEVENLYHLRQFNAPVLALNYTNTSLFNTLPSNFYEFGLSPVEETQQILDKARQAGRSQALVITSDDAWGHRIMDALNSSWKANGGTITDTLYFSKQTNLTQAIASLLHINPKEDQALMRENNNRATLAQQRRQDFDVIFVFAQPDSARQIVPLLRYYYIGNVPIYSISTIYSGYPNPLRDKDLDGVTFSELPWIIQMAHSSSNTPGQCDHLYAIGRDAYLLSQSLPRLNALPNFPIYGATGALSMNQQKISQRLPVVTMHDGRI